MKQQSMRDLVDQAHNLLDSISEEEARLMRMVLDWEEELKDAFMIAYNFKYETD